MNCSSPEQAHVCPCRDQGLAPMFCPTGHLTECHHPLECRQAACSHVQRYEEELTQAQMAQREELAITLLGRAADPRCPRCAGEGRTEVNSIIPAPGLITPDGREDELVINTNAICPCTSEALRQRDST